MKLSTQQIKKTLIAFLIIFFILATTIAVAHNYETVGHTYPITEQDLLQFIKQRLQQLNSDGKLTAIQNNLAKQAQKKIDRPTPLNLPVTTKTHSFYFDPTIVISQNIIDAHGNIIAKAGSKFNPLTLVKLRKELIFYNGDDKRQIKLVKELNKRLNNKTKLILTGGSIIRQTKLFHKAIYFDQSGRLTNHFGINHVPAIVKQVGLKLRISEIGIKNK